MHEPIDEDRSPLDVLAGYHRPSTPGLLPMAALSVVLWNHPNGDEEITVYNAQHMGGCQAIGALEVAKNIAILELFPDAE